MNDHQTPITSNNNRIVTSDASRYANKFNYINLTRHKHELDARFDSMIDKLPDLCMPTCTRLAGEHDFFDATKKLKLIPFRKQEVFDRCISPVNSHLQDSISKTHGSRSGGDVKQRPFANPMPECMLVEDNRDNLREIIVSSLDIEWKMLTSIRAESEYENNYFDKLIQLHRSRYKTRLEFGHFKHDKKSNFTVFRHTRHGISLQHPMLNALHDNQNGSHLNPAVGVKLKRKFRARSNRSKSIVGGAHENKLTIPTLTLTNNDDQQSTSEPVMPGKLDQDEDEEDLCHFSYENFSRFSRRNSTKQMLVKKQSDSTANQDTQYQAVANNGLGFMRGHNLFDDQLEDILNDLMVDIRL